MKSAVALVFLWIAVAAEPIGAVPLAGIVRDDSGNPIPGVMVTISGISSIPEDAITIFSDAKGTFSSPDLGENPEPGKLRVIAKKVGSHQADLDVSAEKAGLKASIVMKRMTLPEDLPASAWFPMTGSNIERGVTNLQCVGCHQFPAPLQRAVLASLKDEPERNQEEAVRGIISTMRRRVVDVLSKAVEGSPNLVTLATSDPKKSIIDRGDEDIITRFILQHVLPTLDKPSHVVPDEVLPPANAVIREYRLPSTSFVREVAVTSRSPYVWGVDARRNQIVRLDPKTGNQKWHDSPGFHPHTINSDAEGTLWITMLESDSIAKFDPVSEKWLKVYDLGVRGAGIHDIAINSSGEVLSDAKGRIWMTGSATNKMVGLAQASGEVTVLDLPRTQGESPLRETPYGAVITKDGKHVWFTQLYGGRLNVLDTETLTVEVALQLERGEGPRRLSIDGDERLWIPLSGSGELLLFDTKKRKTTGRYPLPDRNAHPYNVRWDPSRNVVWVGTSNADRIYRFDPTAETFTPYPLPRSGSFLRMMLVGYDPKDIWTSYALPPANRGKPSMIVRLTP